MMKKKEEEEEEEKKKKVKTVIFAQIALVSTKRIFDDFNWVKGKRIVIMGDFVLK